MAKIAGPLRDHFQELSQMTYARSLKGWDEGKIQDTAKWASAEIASLRKQISELTAKIPVPPPEPQIYARVELVEAVQWHKIGDHPVVYLLEGYPVIDAPEGAVVVAPGDWVVREKDGSFRHVSDKTFQETYGLFADEDDGSSHAELQSALSAELAHLRLELQKAEADLAYWGLGNEQLQKAKSILTAKIEPLEAQQKTPVLAHKPLRRFRHKILDSVYVELARVECIHTGQTHVVAQGEDDSEGPLPIWPFSEAHFSSVMELIEE